MNKIAELSKTSERTNIIKMLKGLKQDEHKPSFGRSIRLQAYNEVLDEAISKIENM